MYRDYYNKITIKNTCPSFSRISDIFTPNDLIDCSPFQLILPCPANLIVSSLEGEPRGKWIDLNKPGSEVVYIDPQGNKNLVIHNARSLQEWREHNWLTPMDADRLTILYKNSRSFQSAFISRVSPPYGIYKKIISDRPNLAIFISMFSPDASKAIWLCKLPGMEGFEQGEQDIQNLSTADGKNVYGTIGGERFVELASCFENAAHSSIFLDSPTEAAFTN